MKIRRNMPQVPRPKNVSQLFRVLKFLRKQMTRMLHKVGKVSKVKLIKLGLMKRLMRPIILMRMMIIFRMRVEKL